MNIWHFISGFAKLDPPFMATFAIPFPGNNAITLFAPYGTAIKLWQNFDVVHQILDTKLDCIFKFAPSR